MVLQGSKDYAAGLRIQVIRKVLGYTAWRDLMATHSSPMLHSAGFKVTI